MNLGHSAPGSKLQLFSLRLDDFSILRYPRIQLAKNTENMGFRTYTPDPAQNSENTNTASENATRGDRKEKNVLKFSSVHLSALQTFMLLWIYWSVTVFSRGSLGPGSLVGNEGLGRGEREKAEDYIPNTPLPLPFFPCRQVPLPLFSRWSRTHFCWFASDDEVDRHLTYVNLYWLQLNHRISVYESRARILPKTMRDA